MTKKIENRKELSDYFKQVNKGIDKYTVDHKIKPSSLSKFIKNNGGTSKFVKDLGLSDISGINKVVDQALKSRLHMEKDGVLKFESFKLLENQNQIEKREYLTLEDIYLQVNPSDIKHEKILADAFDVSLGHIEEVDAKKHQYSISKNIEAYIFTQDDILRLYDTVRDIVNENTPHTIKVMITKNISTDVDVDIENSTSFDVDIVHSVLKDLYENFKVKSSRNTIILYK